MWLVLAVAADRGNGGSAIGLACRGAATRNRQSRQAAPNVTVRDTVIDRVIGFERVAVPACSSARNSSRVNPPRTAGRTGHGRAHRRMPGAGQRDQDVPGLAGGVGEDHTGPVTLVSAVINVIPPTPSPASTPVASWRSPAPGGQQHGDQQPLRDTRSHFMLGFGSPARVGRSLHPCRRCRGRRFAASNPIE